MERDTILVVPYDPQWPIQYEEERHRILQVLGEMIVGIEHFGSTAIPGLVAKPTIDMLLGFPYDDFSLYPCDFSTPTL